MSRGLFPYASKRIVILFVQLFAMTLAVFVLIRLLPTDPVAQRVGILATPDVYAKAKADLGLDKPIIQQLGEYLGQLAHLNFGRSWQTQDSVSAEIFSRFPVTLQLITLAFLVAIVVAIPLALMRAARPGGTTDKAVFGYGLFAGAQPEFWWGLMFIFLFSYKLPIFPQPLGLLDPGEVPPPPITHFILIDSILQGRLDIFRSAAAHFALPVLTLAFVTLGPILKMASQTLVEVRRSDFVLHARARGVSSQRLNAYAFRNALPPVVTLVGILYGYMLGGAVLIEYIFSLNGLGQYALQRTLVLDFPAIQGVVLVMTAFSLLAYLAVDLLYAVIDPRVKL